MILLSICGRNRGFAPTPPRRLPPIGGIMHSTGRPIWALLLCVFLSCAPLSDAQQTAPQPPATSLAPNQLVLAKGTPVKLHLKRDLSSADAKPGDKIDFEVSEEVKVGDVVVIPKGNTAVGTVTDVQAARRMGRGGKLDIEIDHVVLADGEKATLWAVKERNGDGNVGDNGPIVKSSLVFGPVAPLVLLVPGEDAMIPRDTEITGYVVAAMQLDPGKFTATSNIAVPSNPTTAQLEITSDPSGAEVTIDGNFVGRTPSQIEIAQGRHTIAISKAGCRTWERKLELSAGKMTLTATLYPATLKFRF
jgi:PEGA domain